MTEDINLKATKNISRITVVFAFIILSQPSFSQSIYTPINQNWVFRNVKEQGWMSAKHPSAIQQDLVFQKVIDHPFLPGAEANNLWIENEDWMYGTAFPVPQDQLDKKHHKLKFEGLDTYVDVFLNGHLILTSDNMFHIHTVDVTEYLREENEFYMLFHSPIKCGQTKLQELDFTPPTGNDVGEIKVSPVVRKAAYQFGWDWAPRVVTSGIWRPITLISYDEKIEEVIIEHNVDEDLNAKVQCSVTTSTSSSKARLLTFWNDVLIKTTPVKEAKMNVSFDLKKPKLWWPNGWGDAKLNDLRFELWADTMLDSQNKTIGLRQIDLVQEEDSIGTSFFFKVNHQPIHIRGANYVPQSTMPTEVTDMQYHSLINDVRKSNMNMLRVWGGGIYERDFFYDLCDQHGILIWQDFMFANTLYPNDSHFINSVKKEVKDQVQRLHHHPCIATWCGNNEIKVAWENWGWQAQYGYSEDQQTVLENNYRNLFEQTIPRSIKTVYSKFNYTSTSPLSNWGTKENFNHGSMHYWGVFHGNDDFTQYPKNIGRFNSEFGFQSLPNIETLQEVNIKTEELTPKDFPEKRQKSYKGNTPMLEAISDYYQEPESLEEFILLSQWTQAIGMKSAIRNQRIKRHHSMGSLYWQLNDVWPGVSWSSRNVDGRWKPLQYQVKSDFEPLACFLDTLSEKLTAVLVNDLLISKSVDLSFELISFDGRKIFQQNFTTEIPALGKDILSLHLIHQFSKLHRNSAFLKTTIRHEDGQLIDIATFARPKDLELKKGQFDLEIVQDENGLRLAISSEKFVKDCWISHPDIINFKDNYFDILPSETKFIRLQLDELPTGFIDKMKIRCWNNMKR